MNDERRVLFVHAHPDDEVIVSGATMAKYAAEGAHVTLVTCTLGEEGEVLVPGLAHLAADKEDGLGEHRIGELDAAMKALGVTDHRFLGGAGRWRDSGMMGLPTNDRPGCFWQADMDEAVGALVPVIREVRPQVVVTYNENGGYGHPDHIQAHRVTMAAVASTGIPAKVYWTTAPRSMIQRFGQLMREYGMDWDEPDHSPEDHSPEGPEMEIGLPDEQITTWVDTTEFGGQKYDALAAHASQSDNIVFLRMGKEKFTELMGMETFVRVQDSTDAPLPEDDLFAGLR
jgi:N-acetyl-1-D-myo-inositol-2-amino-2-deoxy-alpha-D-glucopyranoside deacetylase